MIANIRRKRQQTIVTFVIDGKEESNAVTINFIPGFLEIIFKGLRARKALSAFKDCSDEAMLFSPSLSS